MARVRDNSSPIQVGDSSTRGPDGKRGDCISIDCADIVDSSGGCIVITKQQKLVTGISGSDGHEQAVKGQAWSLAINEGSNEPVFIHSSDNQTVRILHGGACGVRGLTNESSVTDQPAVRLLIGSRRRQSVALRVGGLEVPITLTQGGSAIRIVFSACRAPRKPAQE